MRSGAAVLAALTAAAVLAVLVVAAGDDRDVAHAVGLPAIGPAGTLAQGQQLCRRDIEVPVAFERVRVVTTTEGLPGPPLEVRVSRPGRATRVARVPGGYQGTVEARVGHLPAGATVGVCVRNLGVREVVLLGIPPGVLLGDLGDTNVQVEFAVVFARDRAVSTLGQVPEMMRRAAIFKPVAPWVLWLLLAGVVLGLPALLVAALRASTAGAGADAPPSNDAAPAPAPAGPPAEPAVPRE
jgi:hypothetical protein